MPNRAERRTAPKPPSISPNPGESIQPIGVQVDINRVLQRYRDQLAQSTEAAFIAQAAQDQLLEENGALRARIADLEAQLAVEPEPEAL